MINVPRDVAALRLQAERAVRADDDAALLELDERLRTDLELWPTLWAPAVAIAAARSDRPGAIELLVDAVAGGFNQPELFEGRLEQCFSGHPMWPDLVAAMAVTPPAPWELLDWPEVTPHPALLLEEIDPDRRDALVARLPEVGTSAWETARSLLTWVHRQWEHANDHVTEADALHVLDRAAAGERFACVEYTIVLTQVLNAIGIPARRLQLFRSDRHQGYGRGHVVSEAWIDDLARWVVLDGQNGAWWTTGDGPLGVLELQAAHRSGSPASLESDVSSYDERTTAGWWAYFSGALTTGYGWGSPFDGVFQGSSITKTPRLLHDGAAAYPDLDQVGIGVDGTRAEPCLVLHTAHPHAIGFEADGRNIDLEEPLLPVDLGTPGEHELVVRVRTAHGLGREHVVRHRVR